MSKKQIRETFRNKVFERAKYCCEMCNEKGVDRQKNLPGTQLDAHHITDRHQFPNGGYVLQNGISVCDECHEKAEQFHSTGISFPDYSPEDLYGKIKSSLEQAIKADARITN